MSIWAKEGSPSRARTANRHAAIRSAVPEYLEALAMPGDHGHGFDNDQGTIPAQPEFAEDDPENAIAGSKPTGLPSQLADCELLAQGSVLQGQGRPGHEHGPEEAEQCR